MSTPKPDLPKKVQIVYTYDPDTGRLNVEWPAKNPVLATFIAIWGWEFIRSQISDKTQKETGLIARIPPGLGVN